MSLNKIIIYMFCIFCTCSCKQDKEQKQIKKLYSENIGKTINLPDSIEHINLNFEEYNKSKHLKIISIMSGECEKCLYALNDRWKNFITLNEEKFQVIFIIQTSNAIFFKKHLLPQIEFNIHAIIDETDRFMKLNNLPGNPLFYTFLLNDKNEIVIIGDPTLDKKIKEMYLEQFNSK